MNKWIKCTDKMPEKDGRYLVVERLGLNLETSGWTWIGVCSLRNGKWDSVNISCWQELPKLPEDNEKDYK